MLGCGVGALDDRALVAICCRFAGVNVPDLVVLDLHDGHRAGRLEQGLEPHARQSCGADRDREPHGGAVGESFVLHASVNRSEARAPTTLSGVFSHGQDSAGRRG